MILYNLIIVYLLFLGYVFQITIKDSQHKKFYLFASFGLFFILSAFRSQNVGNDTQVYLTLFNNISNFDNLFENNTRFELGYTILNRLLALISNTPQIIIIASSIIIMFGFARFIYKYSEIPWLSGYLFFTLGYFGSSMNTIRANIALVILLWSYDYLRKQKLLPFILIVILASFFHITAIIFITMWLFRSTKINTKILLFLFAGSTLVVLFWSKFLGGLFYIFPYFSHYLKTEYFNGEVRLASILNLGVNLSIVFIGFLFAKNEIKKSINFRLMTLFLLFSSAILFISFRFNLLDRIADYLSVFSIIYIPNILTKMKLNINKLIMGSTIILFFYIYRTIILLFRPEWNHIFPYSFY